MSTLAIKGHETRGKEVIQILEMLGGENFRNLKGTEKEDYYWICEDIDNLITFNCKDYINKRVDNCTFFTLEEFLEKYPYKVGDKVSIPEYESEVYITKMKWNGFEIMYCINTCYGDEWFTSQDLMDFNEEYLQPYKEQENMEGMYKFIDLGLPSGTLWANRNVGASSPSDYGSYYAWGETSTKSDYSWSTYTHCDGSYNTCHNIGSNIAGTRYDVARQKWGGSWKMPTQAQWQELIDNCTWTWTTQGGHSGYKVTGPNGNSIFLPAAGYRNGTSSNNVGSGGYYWSSTLLESNASSAWHLSFGSGSHHVYRSYRYYGFTVRPVTEKTNKDKDAIISLTSEEKGMRIVPQNNYELRIDNDEVFVVEKPQYPKTYAECCKILNHHMHNDLVSGRNGHLLSNFQNLLTIRDAYWKIAGEKMGLDKPWEPDWVESCERKYIIYICENEIDTSISLINNYFLAFPTEEMRDAFYENFKDLIEECKELL